MSVVNSPHNSLRRAMYRCLLLIHPITHSEGQSSTVCCEFIPNSLLHQLECRNGTQMYSIHCGVCHMVTIIHDDVIKWKHFPRYWPFVRGIHRSPVDSPHKGQSHVALMFFFLSAPGERVEQTSVTPRSLWRHRNEDYCSDTLWLHCVIANHLMNRQDAFYQHPTFKWHHHSPVWYNVCIVVPMMDTRVTYPITAWCHYNMVNIPKNTQNRCPIAHPRVTYSGFCGFKV